MRRLEPLSFFRSMFAIALLVLGHWCVPAGHPATASTFRALGFEEMVLSADSIVRVTVVNLSYSANPASPTAPGRASSPPKASGAPASQESPEPIDDDTAGVVPRAEGTQPAPISPEGLPTEGGRMIFTTVTLAVSEIHKGEPPAVITLRMPGGTFQGRTAAVVGLPTFVKGRDYFLFLRPGYLAAGDPVSGVNRGFFHIDVDPGTGLEMLLDFNSNAVVGVVANRVMTRRDGQGRAESGPQTAPAPVPGSEYEVVVPTRRPAGASLDAAASAAVAAAPMTPGGLADLVRQILGGPGDDPGSSQGGVRP